MQQMSSSSDLEQQVSAHDIEDALAWKKKIELLIDQNQLTISDVARKAFLHSVCDSSLYTCACGHPAVDQAPPLLFLPGCTGSNSNQLCWLSGEEDIKMSSLIGLECLHQTLTTVAKGISIKRIDELKFLCEPDSKETHDYVQEGENKAHTMEMMYTIIADEFKSMDNKDMRPEDYLNFFCLGNREEPPSNGSPESEKSTDKRSEVFSAFGYVHKIVTFEKAAGFQALIQYTDAATASDVRESLDGRSIPSYLLPEHVTSCCLRISFSAHKDLNIKFQLNHNSLIIHYFMVFLDRSAWKEPIHCKFAHVTFIKPEYLQDSDIVMNRFHKQRHVYEGWEQHLGLEHTTTAPKRSYLGNNQNRHSFEKPVRIYN
ncbi:Polypyrimidine tract-binding 1 [Zea mays]|uniref:Polypyrimidine tract-binding 1 n=1 Tax=Zea mays TaxID=4577 RepID=A0A3L6FSH8_MAIZE|nr:Polypyrimidine tract-binding 1 [Zea mays]